MIQNSKSKTKVYTKCLPLNPDPINLGNKPQLLNFIFYTNLCFQRFLDECTRNTNNITLIVALLCILSHL